MSTVYVHMCVCMYVCVHVCVCACVHSTLTIYNFGKNYYYFIREYQCMRTTYKKLFSLVCISNRQWIEFLELQTVLISLEINQSVALAKYWPKLNLQLSQFPFISPSARYASNSSWLNYSLCWSISSFVFVDSCLTDLWTLCCSPFKFINLRHFEYDTFPYFCCNFHTSFI